MIRISIVKLKMYVIYRMLNCVNTTGHPGGPESSALIEEKQQPPAESCEEEYDYNNL